MLSCGVGVHNMTPSQYIADFVPNKAYVRLYKANIVATLGSNLDSESKLCSDESQSGF